MSTLRELTAEIRQINVEHGWRSAEGGPGANTWGDYVALLHTEISEIVEAFRDRGLTAYTTATGKPDDVGSEVADCVIRLLDMCDVFGVKVFDMDVELADVSPVPPVTSLEVATFGDWTTWLHHAADQLWINRLYQAPLMLRSLVAFAEHWGVALEREIDRKVAYNRTRPFQHGGRTLAGKVGSA